MDCVDKNKLSEVSTDSLQGWFHSFTNPESFLENLA